MVVKKLNSWLKFLKSKHLKVFFARLPASKRALLKAEYHRLHKKAVIHRKHKIGVRRVKRVVHRGVKRVGRRLKRVVHRVARRVKRVAHRKH